MCGIVGFVGKANGVKFLIDGLAVLSIVDSTQLVLLVLLMEKLALLSL